MFRYLFVFLAVTGGLFWLLVAVRFYAQRRARQLGLKPKKTRWVR